jgi:hypothetical protein
MDPRPCTDRLIALPDDISWRSWAAHARRRECASKILVAILENPGAGDQRLGIPPCSREQALRPGPACQAEPSDAHSSKLN